jgi:hypothetical protein
MAKWGDEGEPVTQSPDSVFGLLGDETRLGILQALWDQYDPTATDNAVTFSELFDRVDVTDTGNFNYHLGRLTGHFVRRTDEGYELAAPGFKVVRAVVAGGVTGDPVLTSSPVDATCARCEGRIAISYEDGTIWARCTECEGYWPERGGELFGFSLPPRGLRDRDPEAVLDATIVYSIHRFETMSHGVCPECGGTVDASLSVCTDHDAHDGVCGACGSSFLGVVRLVCSSCKFDWRSPSYAVVSHHPALVAFYDDRGVEHVPATWAAIVRGLRWREELVSTDPASLRVIVHHAGERIDFLLDETARVVDVSD